MARRRFLAALARAGGVVTLALLHACHDSPELTEPDLATATRKTLTITGGGTGNGTVTSSPAGINCLITRGTVASTGCRAQFATGTIVTLTATAATGHAFQQWAQYCAGFAICQPQMSANRSVQARFQKGPFTVKIASGTASGSGTVRSQPGLTPVLNCVITNGIAAATGCSAKYPANTALVLTATPAAGQAFSGWGGVCGGDAACRYAVVRNVTIPGTFSPDSDPARAMQGRWGPAFQTPVVAVHMHLLPTGKVMMWGNKGETNLWDPADPGAGFVPLAKTHQLFCSGHTLLADGRLLVAGGHIASDRGLPQAAIYDPVGNGWTATPNMARGRWYPTVTTLADGAVLTIAGADQQGVMVPVPEIWRNGAWERLEGASLELPYYPTIFVAPNGQAFMAGPDRTSRYLDPTGSGQWTTVGERVGPDREAGSAVMYAPGKVLYVGGGDPPTAEAEVIDLNESAPAWRAVAPMAFPRRHLLATVLADGKVLVTHGTGGAGFNDLSGVVRYAELWDPETESWTTLGREGVARAYHSTAVLLPDGRVLSSGSGEGDGVTFGQSELSAQIFTPPYLFAPDGTPAVRPVIAAAPSTIRYGDAITLETPDAATVTRGSLVRLSSATHSFNMAQLIVPLAFTSAGGTAVTAEGPTGPTMAPPGPYLLFLINGSGVPSIARIVNLGP